VPAPSKELSGRLLQEFDDADGATSHRAERKAQKARRREERERLAALLEQDEAMPCPSKLEQLDAVTPGDADLERPESILEEIEISSDALQDGRALGSLFV